MTTNAIAQGWQCPGCDRIHNPALSTCPTCIPRPADRPPRFTTGTGVPMPERPQTVADAWRPAGVNQPAPRVLPMTANAIPGSAAGRWCQSCGADRYTEACRRQGTGQPCPMTGQTGLRL